MSQSHVQPVTVLRGHSGEVQAAAFSLTESALLSGDSQGCVRCWSLESTRSTATQAHSLDAGVLQVAYLSATCVLTQGRDGEVKVWKLTSDGTLAEERTVVPSGTYNFCKLSVQRGEGGDNNVFAACGQDVNSVQLWDVRQAAVAQTIAGEKEHGMSMALKLPAAMPHLLVTGKESGHVDCWDLRRGQTSIASIKVLGEPCMALDVSAASRDTHADGHSAPAVNVVCGGADAKVVWAKLDVEKSSIGISKQATLPEGGTGDIQVRGDGRIAAVGAWDGRTRVYHVRTGKMLTVLKSHRASVAAVAFDEETKLLATGSRDQTITIWDVYRE